MSDSSERDNLFVLPRDHIVDFTFDDSVADVFPDMVRRSVPGYEQIMGMTGLLASEYAQDNTRIYDLGCSLGASTLAMLRRTSQPVSFVAVDNSHAMVERCQAIMQREKNGERVTVKCASIEEVNIEHASLTVMNFTLQFIAPDKRPALLEKIYRGLCDGGALLISEKICFDDPVEQAFNEKMHEAFKAANGYSELEISQKRTALENVLIPDTLDTHVSRLKAAGFSSVQVWHRCFNFVSLLAIR